MTILGNYTTTKWAFAGLLAAVLSVWGQGALGQDKMAVAPGCPLSGCTFTGPVNTTSAYQQNGGTVLNQINAAQGSLSVGTGAGASLPAGAIFSTFVGWRAGNAFTGLNGEATCIGTIACQTLIDGNFDTAIGEHAGGYWIHDSNSTATGNDSQRNTISIGGGGNTSFGKSSMETGSFTNSTALGFSALVGNSSAVTFTGTPTNGDTETLTFTSTNPGLSGTSPIAITTNITAGETTTQRAAAMITAMNANVTLQGAWFGSTNQGNTGAVISFIYPGSCTSGNLVCVTYGSTGSATETATITGGSAGNDVIAIGDQAAYGLTMSTAQNIIAIGKLSLGNATTDNGSVCIGHLACAAITNSGGTTAVGFGAGGADVTGFSDTYIGYQAGLVHTGNNSTIVGNQAAKAAVGAGQISVFGRNACNKITSGSTILCMGDNVGSTTLATGARNILIGTSSATDTLAAATNDEINVGGLLFWNSNSLAAPAVTACGTSPAIDAHANNRSGTITVGTAVPASCTVTFAGTGYSTWNHCRVMPGTTLAALAYSYTKTVLTITGTALSGNIEYDCDGV